MKDHYFWYKPPVLMPFSPKASFQGMEKKKKSEMLVAQSCLTLCDPMDSRWTGSSVSEILQARILEWVAIPFSRGSS